MAKIYYKKIIAGQMTLDEVSSRWYEEVKAMLEENTNENR